MCRWFQDVEDLASFDRGTRIPLNCVATERDWRNMVGASNDNSNCWFAIDGSDGAVAGVIGLDGISPVNRDCVIPLFVERSLRRTGVGIRATALMLDLAFRQLGLNRVTSYYRDDNESSRDLIARLGFQPEGRLRQAWFSGGRFFDMIAVGLLSHEWEERRGALASELSAGTLVTMGGAPLDRWTWPPQQG